MIALVTKQGEGACLHSRPNKLLSNYNVSIIVSIVLLLLCLPLSIVIQVTANEEQVCVAGTYENGSCNEEVKPESPTITETTSTTTESTNNFENESSCGMFFAESTIPGAGIGIFTVHEKNVGEAVGNGDICIPISDMYWHNSNTPIAESQQEANPLYDYFWTGTMMGMKYEAFSDDIEALCPGMDCAINCNLALDNVKTTLPRYSDANLHRSKDPGFGSFSPYGNGTTLVKRYIPPGGELFKHYGDYWFEGRTHVFGLLPLSNDYPKASKLLQNLVSLFDSVNVNVSVDESLLFKEFYEDIIINTINTGAWESRRLNALPKSYDDARIAGLAGDVTVIVQRGAIRDVGWLQQNGKCIDNIIPRQSTIRQAGHGAFATRFLRNGSIITASPLHHIPDINFMNMYNYTNVVVDSTTGQVDKKKWYKLRDEIRSLQLYNNYCFGHADMTMLLCPYGAGVSYINHNKTLANVAIRWATNFAIVHKDEAVTEWTIDKEFTSTNRPSLAFDYVALRDIQPNEELFLDYGPEWEDAWNEHIEQFNSRTVSQESKRYSSAHQFEKMFSQLPLRTIDEQVHDPYPSNLHMRCHRSTIQQSSFNAFDNTKPLVQKEWSINHYGLPCRILDRFIESINGTDTYLYTIQIEYTSQERAVNDSELDEEDEIMYDDEGSSSGVLDDYIPLSRNTVTWIERTDVPRSAINFFDQPQTTDIHVPTAFRHEILIPDDMIPQQWRNLLF